MKTPTVLFGEASRDGEFSSHVRLVKLIARFDFDEPNGTVDVTHEEVRHDVSASPRSTRPRSVLLIEQLNLQARLCLTPRIMDLQRLLLNRCHERAIRQDHSRRRFELSLAAN